MWCKMLNSIAGLDKHCLVERTAEDWERAKTQDMAKIKTRSMKVISHDIAKAFASAEAEFGVTDLSPPRGHRESLEGCHR